ncbi:MAG: disulfide bond formation protein B [Burkholderiales bacterium]|nr:disulfide bond formation protein B [Burkholderiales bacterium]
MRRSAALAAASSAASCEVLLTAGAAQAASVLPRLARPPSGRRLRIQPCRPRPRRARALREAQGRPQGRPCVHTRPQVSQDLLDHRPLEDGRDDLQLAAAAVRAVLHVDVKDALEQPRPADAVQPCLATWQRFVAAEQASCAMTLADRLIGDLGLDARWPEVSMATAACADKPRLFDLPYEYWSGALFALLLLAALWLLLRGKPRERKRFRG